ncbi:MAG: type II secretion system F family protein [Kribbellaceae bacterium]
MTGLLAVLFGALAAELAVAPRNRRLRGLRGFRGLRGLRGPDRRAGRTRWGGPRRIARAGAVCTATLVVAVLLGGRATVVVLTLAVISGTALWLRRRSRRRAETAARRGRVIEACAVLTADLRAGRVPRDALAAAAEVCPDLLPAVTTARLGGDVAAVLDRSAETPGAAGLRALGASWRVAEESGAAFAGVCERVADALRTDEQVRRQVAAGLAGARSTARLLAGLPLLGLVLGHVVGARPMAFLTGTVVGCCCLALGLGLAVTGLAWVERLADSCEDRTERAR